MPVQMRSYLAAMGERQMSAERHKECQLHRICLLNGTVLFLCVDHIVYVCGACWEDVGDYIGTSTSYEKHGCMSQKTKAQPGGKKARSKSTRRGG
jgi:hypothetical protein